MKAVWRLGLVLGTMGAASLVAGCSTGNQDSPFQAQYVIGLTHPEVRIKNESDRTIEIHLLPVTDDNELQDDTGDNWTVRPSGIVNMVMNPGEYAYRATAPGVVPASGTTTFQRNYRYSWTFYIAPLD